MIDHGLQGATPQDGPTNTNLLTPVLEHTRNLLGLVHERVAVTQVGLHGLVAQALEVRHRVLRGSQMLN
jgi:hypothetical protein